jgi:hypothetical protein
VFQDTCIDIGATKFGSWCTDDTVSHYFCRDHVSGMRDELVWIIDKVAADSDSNSIWVIFGVGG